MRVNRLFVHYANDGRSDGLKRKTKWMAAILTISPLISCQYFMPPWRFFIFEGEVKDAVSDTIISDLVVSRYILNKGWYRHTIQSEDIVDTNYYAKYGKYYLEIGKTILDEDINSEFRKIKIRFIIEKEGFESIDTIISAKDLEAFPDDIRYHWEVPMPTIFLKHGNKQVSQ